MNMRLFAALGGIACMVLTSACVIVGSDGTGGSGGQGGQGGQGGAGGAGGQGGAGGGGACTESCAEASTNDMIPFCMTANGKTAEDLYNAAYDCSCGAAGICTSVCTAYCGGGAPEAECVACLGVAGDKGCADQVAACSNN